MCACFMQYIKSQLVDFTLTDDVTTYYWIEKQTYITYNTLNYSPNDVSEIATWRNLMLTNCFHRMAIINPLYL